MGLQKQKYHLEPDRGLLNDPNGLAYYKGKFYAFFQWNRFAKDHCYKEWGLFHSTDLVHWDFEGSALLPDQIYDKDGVYSGSACQIGDQLYLFYTGNNKTNGKRTSSQCLAVTSDGKKYLKYGCVLPTPEVYTENFRDPKVFRGASGDYFMVVGAQRKCGKGAVALARSKDGIHWKPAGDLARTEQYEMIECPDLFRLDGADVLIYGLQQRDNEKDTCGISFSAYKISSFDEKTATLTDADLDHYNLPDYGFDFYAPQTFADARGRRILFAWMSRMDADEERVFSANEKNIHCLTLPRELHVKDGKLYQNVPAEYESLKGAEIPLTETRYAESPRDKFFSSSAAAEYKKSAVFPDRTGFIKIAGIAPQQNLSVCSIEDGTKITYIGEQHLFSLKRYNWVTHCEEEKKLHLSSLASLEIWLDTSSLEIFLNDGEYIFSSRIYVRAQQQTVLFSGISSRMTIECRQMAL